MTFALTSKLREENNTKKYEKLPVDEGRTAFCKNAQCSASAVMN